MDNEEETEAPTEKKVDKDEIMQKIEKGEYDMSLHFSKKGCLQIDANQKVRSFQTYWLGSSKKVDIILSVASSNQIFRYKFDMKSEDEANMFKLTNKVGPSIGCH